MKKVIKIVGIVMLALVLLIGGYVAYIMLTYHRIEDHQSLSADAAVSGQEVKALLPAEEEKEYTVVSANIGFGAYDQEFDFFMDGGTQSWGKNKERVQENVLGILAQIKEWNPDFLLLQEVDIDATRSYHMDQYDMVREEFPLYETMFAQNYDSGFLFWPLYQPHGKTQAGLVTASTIKIQEGLRRSLPIAESLSKFLDLDRCYSIGRIFVENGKELVLFNVHLSAYGADAQILKSQREMLYADMKAEYEKGNYVIVGGDFNHDMVGDSDARFQNRVAEEASWAKKFDFDSIPEGFTLGCKKMVEEGAELAATCRDAGCIYDGTNDRWVLDAFLYSDNIEMVEYENMDLDFLYSDHNPVRMKFKIKK